MQNYIKSKKLTTKKKKNQISTEGQKALKAKDIKSQGKILRWVNSLLVQKRALCQQEKHPQPNKK